MNLRYSLRAFAVVLVVMSLSNDVDAQDLAAAFENNGWEPPSPGNPRQIEIRVSKHPSGSALRDGAVGHRSWAAQILPSFAEAAMAQGGWVTSVSAGPNETLVTTWRNGQREVISVSNALSMGDDEREYETEEREVFRRRCVPEIGESTRQRVVTLAYRVQSRTPKEEILSAIERGDVVDEIVAGRTAFRFPWQGGMRILVVNEVDAESLRQHL